ncbi:hypothetical protein AMS68_006752 [Peltaster fructicola]|uniref:SCP domain-containing protein n=1 Tax=Peltaster fructicola TaxID=286661 RepID=A0A6H0Y2U3_9PEZI|nr:hypothetical protein AMS68_006752 [Peltaster fructicola]
MLGLSHLLALGLTSIAAANAAGTATFVLADRASYSLSGTYTATLTGSGIDIIGVANAPAATSPANGLDVHIGSDLKKQLGPVVEKYCSGNDHNECYNQIRSVVVSQNTDIQVRQALAPAVVLGTVLVALVSVWVQWFFAENAKNALVPDVHIPAVQLGQASSIYASSISVIALATGTETPFATITPQASLTFKPSPALITPAAVTTVAADTGSNKKGDIVYKITESQARRWQEILARTNNTFCELAEHMSRSLKARSGYNPLWSNVLCGSEVLLANMYAGGQAAGLTYALPERFNWVDHDANEAMHLVQQYARQNAPNFGIGAVQADRYGIAAFTVSRAVLLQGNTLVGDSTTPSPIVIAAVDIDLAHPPGSACEDHSTTVGIAGCRFQGNIEACTTFYASTTTCLESSITAISGKRYILTTNILPWTVNDPTPYPSEVSTTAAAAPAPTDNVRHVDQGDLRCGNRSDSGNAKYFVDRDMLIKAADFFCDKQIQKKVYWPPGKVPDDQKHIEMHYNDHEGDPVLVSMDIGSDPGCPAVSFLTSDARSMCIDRLMNPIDGCDTQNPGAHYWWKQGGTFYRDCVTWSIRRDPDWIFSGLGAAPPQNKIDDSWRSLGGAIAGLGMMDDKKLQSDLNKNC